MGEAFAFNCFWVTHRSYFKRFSRHPEEGWENWVARCSWEVLQSGILRYNFTPPVKAPGRARRIKR